MNPNLDYLEEFLRMNSAHPRGSNADIHSIEDAQEKLKALGLKILALTKQLYEMKASRGELEVIHAQLAVNRMPRLEKEAAEARNQAVEIGELLVNVKMEDH